MRGNLFDDYIITTVDIFIAETYPTTLKEERFIVAHGLNSSWTGSHSCRREAVPCGQRAAKKQQEQ